MKKSNKEKEAERKPFLIDDRVVLPCVEIDHRHGVILSLYEESDDWYGNGPLTIARIQFDNGGIKHYPILRLQHEEDWKDD